LTLPQDHRFAKSTDPLVPGMTILAGSQGEWHPAEVIDLRGDGKVLVKFLQLKKPTAVLGRDWLAVDEKTLAEAQANAQQLAPSMKVLPGGTVNIPDGYIPIPEDAILAKGMPVKAERAKQFQDATVIDIRSAGGVIIAWDGVSRDEDRVLHRSSIIISPETLELLKQPEQAAKFSERLAKLPPPTEISKRTVEMVDESEENARIVAGIERGLSIDEALGSEKDADNWDKKLEHAVTFQQFDQVRALNRAVAIVNDEQLQSQLKSCPAIKRPVTQLFVALALEMGAAQGRTRPKSVDLDVGKFEMDKQSAQFFLQNEVEQQLGDMGEWIVQGLAERYQNQTFGSWPQPSHGISKAFQNVPMLPIGSSSDLLAEAKKRHADVIVVAKMDFKSAGGRGLNPTLTFRIVDVQRGEELWKSKPLANDKILAGKKRGNDPSVAFVDELFEWMDRNLKLKPMPKFTPESARKRAEKLVASPADDTLATVAELRYYQTAGLLTATEAERFYVPLLGEDQARQLASSDPVAKKKAIAKLLPSGGHP
jgi:hypothetical protein